MKKAQMQEFLFYTILALVIFIPTVLWASQFFKLSNKSLSSYNQLTSTIGSIKDGEFNSVILYMNPESLIVGFTNNSDKTEAVAYPPAGLNLIFDYANRGYIERPLECEKGKSCVCLCQKIAIDGNKIICQDKAICNQFNNLDFFYNRPVGEVPFSHSKNSFVSEWRGGFFIINSKDSKLLKKIYTNVDTIQPSGAIKSPMPVYVQRYKNYVNACLNRNCITNEMIDKLNKEDALKEFNRFKEFYANCAAKDGQVCSAFSLNLPERYYIYYGKLSSRILSISIPFTEKSALILINTEDSSLNNIKKNLNNIGVKDDHGNLIYFNGNIWRSQDKEYDEGVLPEYTELIMTKNNDKIILSP